MTSDALCQAIHRMMEQETARIIEVEAKAAAERVADRVRGMTGEIAARVSKMITYEHPLRNELVITVRIPDEIKP
jgi:dihydroneopterin aldolase